MERYMRSKLALSFFVCVILFAQQVWPGSVDTTAAYMTVFGRPATQAEIDYWKNRLPATQDELVEININWLVSPSGAKDLKETVVRGFQQVFQREPTGAEQQEWENKIKTSRLKYQDFVNALKPSATSIQQQVKVLTVPSGTIQPSTTTQPSPEPEPPFSITTTCFLGTAWLDVCVKGKAGTTCTKISYPCFPNNCQPGTKGVTCAIGCNDDSGCAHGAKCLEGICTVVPVYSCDDDFTLQQGGYQIWSCKPYKCIGGQCLEHCNDDSGCSESFKCVNQVCVKK
jgi:hypothetical protein